MDTQRAPLFVPFPATVNRITTRFLSGYQRDDRTLIFCDGIHALTVVGVDGGVSVFAVHPETSRLTHVTSHMPNHVTTHTDAVRWWKDELANRLEGVA